MTSDAAPSGPSPAVGDEDAISVTITDEDVRRFAEISRDANPVHLDSAYASQTQFGARIVHGALLVSYISAVLGTRLPGPGSIYVSQTSRFRRPVYIGETVTARVRVTAWDSERRRVTLETAVLNAQGEEVVIGEAQLVVRAA